MEGESAMRNGMERRLLHHKIILELGRETQETGDATDTAVETTLVSGGTMLSR